MSENTDIIFPPDPDTDEHVPCFRDRMAKVALTVMPAEMRDAPRWAQKMWEEGALRTEQNKVQGEMLHETLRMTRAAVKRMGRMEDILTPVVKSHRRLKYFTKKTTMVLLTLLTVVAGAVAKSWVESRIDKVVKAVPPSVSSVKSVVTPNP